MTKHLLSHGYLCFVIRPSRSEIMALRRASQGRGNRVLSSLILDPISRGLQQASQNQANKRIGADALTALSFPCSAGKCCPQSRLLVRLLVGWIWPMTGSVRPKTAQSAATRRSTARLAFPLLADSLDDERRPGDAAPLRLLAKPRLQVGGRPEADGHVFWLVAVGHRSGPLADDLDVLRVVKPVTSPLAVEPDVHDGPRRSDGIVHGVRRFDRTGRAAATEDADSRAYGQIFDAAPRTSA
jgi:hypothetical protein